ncbi:phage protease [Cereibacter sphaeroides]|uniref:phage protease n=1 Tax=Cereibacter sphaeroides TaxID=1063 RepID=UPI001558834B|nr:phage protease [Cereibacter sphaeroides]
MATPNDILLPGLALNVEGSAAPEWVQLVPAGPSVEGRDGRRWTMADPALIVDAFERHGADLPVDFEHATQIKGARGEAAPAVGWIKALEARNGSLWGRVDWNAEGASAVASRAYRYLSPVFRFDPVTKAVLTMVSAGLTNAPNLHLAALNRAHIPDMEIPAMDPAVLQALGLKPDATAADAVVAINRLQEAQATALNAARHPDPEAWVPRADHQLALNRITAFETAEKVRTDREAEALVDAAIAEGKIAPVSRDYHLATCRAEGGLERFRAYAASAPVIAAPSGLGAKAPARADGRLTAEDLAVCRMLGMAEDEFAAARAAEKQE